MIQITQETEITVGDWVLKSESNNSYIRLLVVGVTDNPPAYELLLNGMEDMIHFGATKELLIQENYLLEQ